MFGLVFVSLPLKHVFIVFHNNKKKMGENMQNFFFILTAFQILHVFLPDISVHCALLEYDFI